MDTTTTKIPFELQEKIAALQAALLDQHPQMPTLLREIHTALRAQPENVTLLSEEDICTIVNGLQKQTNTFLATTVTKSAKNTTGLAKLKKLGADAF